MKLISYPMVLVMQSTPIMWTLPQFLHIDEINGYVIQGISLRVRTPSLGHSREGILTVWQHPPDLTARETVLRLDSKSQSRQPTVSKTESWKLTSVAEGLKGYLGTRRNTTKVISVSWGSQSVCRFELPPYGKPYLQCPLKWNYSVNHSTDAQEMPISAFLLFFISGFQAKPSIQVHTQVPFSIKSYSRRQCRL